VISYSQWWHSRLFRSYLTVFPFLWALTKAANAFTASVAGIPPLGFRPFTEMVACAIELIVLATYIRRDNEDILIGNLGIPLLAALLPLVLIHVILSALLALAA
jgi:hypothetical protein